ncbi:MAG TPA: YfjI family protein [Jiangellaceae bacterium]
MSNVENLAGWLDAARHQPGAPEWDEAARYAETWDGDPVPLKTERLLRPFPVEVFPDWLVDEMEAIACATQTPIDLAASLGLACLATAAGGKVLVELDGSWIEQTNLYTVVALPPGSRKSPVFRAMTAPIKDAEQALREIVAPQRSEAGVMLRTAKARAETAAIAAEHSTDPAAVAEAVAAAEEVERITVPAKPQLTTDDVTPETCTSLLAQQGGRLAILSAEGDAFATVTGMRYSNTSNLGVFLKGHAGDAIHVDRLSRESETIDRPALTMGITTQPKVLRELAGQPDLLDRGALGRLLYSLPENTVGNRKPRDARPVPSSVTASYGEHIKTLVLTLAAHTAPHMLTITAEARDVLLDFDEWLEPKLHPDTGQFANIASWANKLTGSVIARVAALLHLAHHYRTGYDKPISADTMRDAENVGRYYLDHALATFDLMGKASPTLTDARRVLRWITSNHHTDFTRRELFNAVRSQHFERVDDLEPALDLLTDHGYIARRPAEPNAGRGRPKVTYDVHPATHQQPLI